MVEHTLVTSAYFLYDMEEWEARTMCEYLPYANRPTWETARLMVWSEAQCHSKKKLKITDIFSLPYDNETKQETTISNEDIKRLRERARNISKNYR